MPVAPWSRTRIKALCCNLRLFIDTTRGSLLPSFLLVGIAYFQQETLEHSFLASLATVYLYGGYKGYLGVQSLGFLPRLGVQFLAFAARGTGVHSGPVNSNLFSAVLTSLFRVIFVSR